MEFKDKEIEAFWLNPYKNIPLSVPPDLRKVLFRKLQLLDAASSIRDLMIPAGNHLEKLVGNRKGEYSIRVNYQWRLCFIWTDQGAIGVELDDYH